MAAFKALRASEGRDCCEKCRWRPPRALRDFAKGRIDSLLHAHHILPVSCGGADAPENLILLCPRCHAVAHHLGRIRRIGRGEAWYYEGPSTRGDLLFCFTMITNRDEYLRFAAMGHRREPYLALVHDEALVLDVNETIRVNRAFTVERGRPRKVFGRGRPA